MLYFEQFWLLHPSQRRLYLKSCLMFEICVSATTLFLGFFPPTLNTTWSFLGLVIPSLLSDLLFRCWSYFVILIVIMCLVTHDRHNGKGIKQIKFPAKLESHTSLAIFMAQGHLCFLIFCPHLFGWLVGCSCSCNNYNSSWLTRAILVLSGSSPGATLNFFSRTVLLQIP